MSLFTFSIIILAQSFFASGATLASRQTGNAVGFPLFAKGTLSNLGLPTACESVLYSRVQCDNLVKSFGSASYRGSLGDVGLTNAVCDAKCSTSLATIHRLAARTCTNTNLFPGLPTLSLVDSIWGGWNETCISDPTTKENCNDIIDSWAPVDDIAQMPKANMCSYCYTNKLAVMQRNIYGAYSTQGYQEMYEYVVKACELSGTVTEPSQGIQIPDSDTSTCASAETYTTKAGDTCDSIARSKKVSSATLYDTNPMLLDCDVPEPGLQLCLPSKCEKLHSVQGEDTCLSISSSTGVSWQQIIEWNSILNQGCSNIQNANPSWGHTLCVSPPGGAFSTTPPANGTDGGVGGPGGNGDGYADSVIDPPSGISLASGTTKNCGQFHVAQLGDTCVVIVTNVGTPSDLFIAVNPSLVAADGCDTRLKVGLAYCVSPIRAWNTTDVAVPSNVPSATSTIVSSTILASATSTPSPSGKISTDGTCAGTSGFTCSGSSFGNCCSEYDWCGDSEGHCSLPACQSAFGDCGTPTPTTSTANVPTSVAKVSEDGTCGGGGGFLCVGSTFGECCSEYGWCGDTSGHCGAGCQSAFGDCTSAAQRVRRSHRHMHFGKRS